MCIKRNSFKNKQKYSQVISDSDAVGPQLSTNAVSIMRFLVLGTALLLDLMFYGPIKRHLHSNEFKFKLTFKECRFDQLHHITTADQISTARPASEHQDQTLGNKEHIFGLETKTMIFRPHTWLQDQER